MHISVLAAVCGLLTSAIAAPAANSKRHVVHERRDRAPTNWGRSTKLPGDAVLPVRIALAQRNLDKADEYLMDVSHPDSPNFGKHWTAKQVAEAFAPSSGTVESVTQWLADAGISHDRVKQSQGLNWIDAKLTVDEAESLLKTKYYNYEHAQTGQVHVASEDYSIPEDIRKHVDFITPTVHFDSKVAPPKKKRALDENETTIAKGQASPVGHKVQPGTGHSIATPGSGSLPKLGAAIPWGTIFEELKNCDSFIVPSCLRALYQLPDGIISHADNSLGIVELTPQAYRPSDLDLFFTNFSTSLVGKRPKLDSINGGYLQTEDQGFGFNAESNLDLEYAMALVHPQEVTLYQVGDAIQSGSFNNYLDALDASYCTSNGGDDPTQDPSYPSPYGGYQGPRNCGGFAATKVISVSYGYNEADLTPFYEQRQCNEYLKLGLQGVTFVYSSGDYGVGGNGDQCIDPATGIYNDGTSGRFNPGFPATCPYVTSVGATQVQVNATLVQPEVAAESVIYSGGGFSNVFATPSYQADALATYFEKHPPSYGGDIYNNSRKTRGFPDVAANGVNYVIGIEDQFSLIYGTSASAPTFASVLTLINAARLAIGKSSIGFVNPALYANPLILNDITSGRNPGCGTDGFEAVHGWDPVTGLGTPNFPRMLLYFLLLP